ncbi:class I SAM-dependent methyltransferase [Oceanobacter antarcticus]|uniref:50S ribosomal protein L11 methyltransferase n=1 Tax=Oceanobacter antarcticus TaxID=3133425 RepID=A0ABW8NH26_9GAMM
MNPLHPQPPEALLAGLQQHAVWADAGLALVPLEHDIRLWLLAVNEQRLFDATEIAALWRYMPYWAFAWAGGRAMSSFLVQQPYRVAGKRVLDIGCGGGIAALQAARQGASMVGVCDIDPLATLAAQHNASLNGVVVEVVRAGDWGDFDVFLAGDLLYDPASHPLLAELQANISAGLTAEPAAALRHFFPSSAAAAQDSGLFATLPAIGDFDQQVLIEIHAMPHSP